MQRGISLVAMAQQLEAEKALKADYIVPAQHLRMRIQNDRTPVIEHDTIGSFPILASAHDQLGGKLGIPAKYYDRMLFGAPDLLASNVNTWLAQDQDRRMMRTLGGDLRALLSDRYNRIEHAAIAEVTLPVLMSQPGLSIVSCAITEKRLHITAVTDRVQGEVKVGDVVQAGVTISNSETGHGALTASPLIFRLACLNGMVINDAKMRRAHLGRRVDDGEDLNAIFADDTRRADDRAILLKVRDVVKAALDDAVFGRALDKMRGLTERVITGDPAKAVEVLARKVGATDDERGGILRSLIEGGDLSAWGVLNAVTHQAHTARSYDRNMEFVAAGGALLDLPASEWRSILEPA